MATSQESRAEVEVVVGTYEEFILGYKMTVDENDKHSLSISFTNHTHSKSIRAVATVGKYVAAGSADESINLINMEARREHGNLQQQSGTITCLADHDGSYLFSGCEDGTICIWKKGNWLCEKTLNAHTGGVIDISVHPSGKLALSVGKDKAIKTWNLVKGRCGYVTNLKAVADAVRWSPEGDFYAVSLANRVDVYSLQTAKVVYTIPVGKRISCLTFVNNTTLAIAGDKETVEVHDIKSSKKLSEFVAHSVRVKSMRYVDEVGLLFTASNDGFIKIWRFPKVLSKAPKLLTELDTSCRITCMAVWVKTSEGAVDEEQEELDEDETVELDEDDEEENNDNNSDSDDNDLEDEEEDSSEEEQEQSYVRSMKRMKVEKAKKSKDAVKTTTSKKRNR